MFIGDCVNSLFDYILCRELISALVHTSEIGDKKQRISRML